MPLVAPVITATLPSSRPMSFPHLSDAGFSITPACRNSASRAWDGLADGGHYGLKTRVFRYVRPYFGFADRLM
jgi:hypothetical protein